MDIIQLSLFVSVVAYCMKKCEIIHTSRSARGCGCAGGARTEGHRVTGAGNGPDSPAHSQYKKHVTESAKVVRAIPKKKSIESLRGGVPNIDELIALNNTIDEEPCRLLFVEDDLDLKE